MAILTVAAMAEELATELGEAYSDQDVSFQFHSWVTEAVAELWEQETWPFALRTLDKTAPGGDGGITLADDAGVSGIAVRDITDSATGMRLEALTRETLLHAGVNLATRGQPVAWYYENGIEPGGPQLPGGANTIYYEPLIMLYPVPVADTDVVVRYVAPPPELLDTDVLPIPFDALRALRENVRMRYYMNSGKLEQSAAHSKRWEGALAALRRRYISQPEIDNRVAYRDIRARGARWPVPRLPQTIPG